MCAGKAPASVPDACKLFVMGITIKRWILPSVLTWDIVLICFAGMPFGFSTDDVIDLEKEFEENVLNSAVYLISMAMQISNFAVNYKATNLDPFP